MVTLIDGREIDENDVRESVRFIGIPWSREADGSVFGMLGGLPVRLTPQQIAGMPTIPLENSDRFAIVFSEAYRQFLEGIGPWKVERGEIIRARGADRLTIRDAYSAMVEILLFRSTEFFQPRADAPVTESAPEKAVAILMTSVVHVGVGHS